MDVIVPLVVCCLELSVGLTFVLFPRWVLRMVCRCASSYMFEDLSSDPIHVMAFRIYGLAAIGLGAYSLSQVIQFMAQNT